MKQNILIKLVFMTICSLICSISNAQTYQFQKLNSEDIQKLPKDLKAIHRHSESLVQNLVIQYPNGIIKKSLFIGKANAPLINAIGGTFTHGLYLRDYAFKLGLALETQSPYSETQVLKALVERRFAINLTEPSGFGKQLTGVIENPKNLDFGILEMIAEHLSLTEILSEISSRKILNIGHSLGGFILDLSSIGVTMDAGGNLFFSPQKAIIAANKTRGNILLGTPFALAQSDFDSKLVPLFTSIGPMIVQNSRHFQNLYSWLHRRGLLHPNLIHIPLKSLQSSSNLSFPKALKKISLVELVDLKYLKAKDIHELVKHTISSSYPAKILQEFEFMLTQGDLILAFSNLPNASLRELYLSRFIKAKVPSFLSSNYKDPVARPKDILMHETYLKALGVPSQSLLLDGGHMNSALGILTQESIDAAASMFQNIDSALVNKSNKSTKNRCLKSAS